MNAFLVTIDLGCGNKPHEVPNALAEEQACSIFSAQEIRLITCVRHHSLASIMHDWLESPGLSDKREQSSMSGLRLEKARGERTSVDQIRELA
jgi:hypothetical protein